MRKHNSRIRDSPQIEIKEEKLGRARVVKEVSMGTMNDKMIVIEDCQVNKAVTILVRGSSTMIVDEAKRYVYYLTLIDVFMMPYA